MVHDGFPPDEAADMLARETLLIFRAHLAGMLPLPLRLKTMTWRTES
jgi:hypothetical protein